MTSFIALLRAVNVGGTGKLPMTELKAMCESPAFAVANILARARDIRGKLEGPWAKALKKRLWLAPEAVTVMVRTAAEMARCWRKIRFRIRRQSDYGLFSMAALPWIPLEACMTRRREVCRGVGRSMWFTAQTWRSRRKIPAARRNCAKHEHCCKVGRLIGGSKPSDDRLKRLPLRIRQKQHCDSHGGVDVPGLNPAIRAIRKGVTRRYRVVGIAALAGWWTTSQAGVDNRNACRSF